MDDEGSIKRARRHRREMTPPEVRLWLRFRAPPQGQPKFRRQHPLGRLTLDFYCVEARLAVEVDGKVHDTEDAADRDGSRDRWLRTQRVHVVRVPASEIMADADAPVDRIWQAAAARIARRPPPPRR